MLTSNQSGLRANQGMKQISFAQAEQVGKKRINRREKFLGEMQQVVPFARLEAVIAPHYPTSGRRGRPPVGLALMLRINNLY